MVERIEEMYNRIGYWVVVRNSKGVYIPLIISHISITLNKEKENIFAVTSAGYEIAITNYTVLHESVKEATESADKLNNLDSIRKNNNNLIQKRSV
jgi:hypothetical protein